MKSYYIYTTLFLLDLLLWLSAIFYLTKDAAGFVGFAAFLLTIAIVAYGFDSTEK